MNNELIPPGIYNAVAVPVVGKGETTPKVARWGKAGEKKTKQVIIYFEILDGPHQGTRLPWFGFLTKDSFERTLQSLRYAGWKGDDIFFLEPLDQEVSVTVEHHEYNDKVYARVAWVNRPGGGVVKIADPMSEAEIREFSAKMKAHAQRIGPVEGKKVAREKKPTNGNLTMEDAWRDREPPSHDDIPF